MSKNIVRKNTKDYTVMNVNDMLKKLSRYPMEERLGIMFNNSMKFINNSYSVVATNEKNEVQPWEMDTFLLLCIMANNNTTPNTFNSKQGKRINCFMAERFKTNGLKTLFMFGSLKSIFIFLNQLVNEITNLYF